MTITTNPSRDEYTSSPGQTVFNYTFKIYANTDLNVYVTPEGQEADDAADISTDYTVDSNTIGDEAGGFITFNNPLADGDKVTILSSIPYNRTVDYQNNGDFRPDTVNSDNDRQVSQIKQIESGLSRTLQFPSSLQNATGVSMDPPESGKYVRWKSDLSGLENVELPPGQVAANGVVLIYPDVPTMKVSTDDNLIPGITVATQGYYTTGDGGGALYLIATPQAADEYGDHTLANSNVALLQGDSSVNVRQYGAKGDDSTDDWAAFNAAIATGKNVFAPGGDPYVISQTLKVTGQGQRFYGDGWSYGEFDVGTTLRWAGSTGNFLEMNSGRRDQTDIGLALKGARIDNIQLTQYDDGSACDNFLWVENGCFQCRISDVAIWVAGNAPNEAGMRVGSDDTSYVNGCEFERIFIRGSTVNIGGPVPVGLWVNGAIETDFKTISVYSVEVAFQIGGLAATYRNVQACTFTSLHCEVGDRGQATVGGAALKFYAGSNLRFYGSKFQMPTTDSTVGWENFRGVQFRDNGDGDILEEITFDGCLFSGNRNADYAIFDDKGDLHTIAAFPNCTFSEFDEGIVDAPFPATPQYNFDGCEFYRTRFYGGRKSAFAGRGYDFGSINLASEDADNYTLTNFNSTRTQLSLGSVTHPNSQPVLYTGAKSVLASASWEANLLNSGAGTAITSADNVIRVRPILEEELITQMMLDYTGGAVANGGVYTQIVKFPGVMVGDFIEAGYVTEAAVGSGSNLLTGLIFSAQVTADNTVELQILNKTGAARTPLGPGKVILAKTGLQYDMLHVETYDAPSLNNVTFLNHDITIAGVKVGDYVHAAPLTDTQSIFIKATVKADDTVTLVFYNQTGGAIDLPSIDYAIGVIHQPDNA